MRLRLAQLPQHTHGASTGWPASSRPASCVNLAHAQRQECWSPIFNQTRHRHLSLCLLFLLTTTVFYSMTLTLSSPLSFYSIPAMWLLAYIPGFAKVSKRANGIYVVLTIWVVLSPLSLVVSLHSTSTRRFVCTGILIHES